MSYSNWYHHFKRDRKQLLRLRRTGVALGGAIILTGLAIVFLYQNILRLTNKELLLGLTMFWIGNLGMLLVIISGLNKKFKDPSLRFLQFPWAIISIMTLIYFSNNLRALLLIMIFLVYMIGTISLTKRQLYLLIALSILAYELVILLLAFTPAAIFNLTLEMTTFLVFSTASISFGFLSREFIDLREYYHAKTGILTTSLHRAKTESLVDELTNVGNRRFIIQVLEHQRLLIERQSSYHVCVLLIDIDHFKKVNDSFGHAIGDQVLIKFCRVIEQTLRKADYFGRIGGEEFIIIMPFIELLHGVKAAERIGKIIEETDFNSLVHHLKITISIGVAGFQRSESIEHLLKRLDNALYIAKTHGRNQVVASNENMG